MQKTSSAPYAAGMAVVGLIVAVALLFGLVVLYYVPLATGGDWFEHIRLVAQWRDTGVLEITHLLFHTFTLALSSLALPLNAAAVIVILLSCEVTALILYARMRRVMPTRPLGVALAVSAALALMLIVPIPLLTLPRLYIGYIGITTYHSPTMLLLKPLALLLFAFTLSALDGTLKLNVRTALIALLWCVLATFAKPNYTLSLLPALGLVVVWRLFVGRRDLRRALESVALPIWIGAVATAILGFQYLLQYQFINVDAVGIGFAPFATVWYYDASRLTNILKFFMSIAFPLAVTGLYWRTIRRDFVVGFSWLTFGMGAAQMYLLTEVGARAAHGNFWWGAQITLFLLFIVALEWLVRHWDDVPRWRAWLCLGVFALHLVSGIHFYGIQFTTSIV
ncbi:MAG: hypothetical protein SGI73_12540 [Chloroflexota bacterium]|nr:hypothetical protein [Chloroflexota bacterium]